MSKTLHRFVAILGFAIALLTISQAQQMSVELGPEKTAAVNVMLKSIFPDATPFWDVDVHVQVADGSRTRLALTPVIKLSTGALTEFVAGIQESAASGNDAKRLRSGLPVSGEHSRERLVAVTRDNSGAFNVVASYILEPDHMLTSISRLGTDPTNPAGIVITYKTIDLYQGQTVEVVWSAQLNSQLGVIRKYPQGIEIKDPVRNTADTIRYVVPNATSISIIDPQTGKQTQLPCTAVCEPTLQQLLGAN